LRYSDIISVVIPISYIKAELQIHPFTLNYQKGQLFSPLEIPAKYNFILTVYSRSTGSFYLTIRDDEGDMKESQ